MRNELCSNNLNDFGLKKGLDNLDAVRQTFKVITSRFAGFQAQWLNVHVDFPLLQRIALPITIGSVRYPGIKIHDRRVIRLLEVLLHGGTHVGGWTAKEIHQSVRTTFGLSERSYGLNQLRYDLRKLKGHGLLERDGSRYAYRLTPKGVQVALLFLFFHKRLCGPLANSRFHHRPDPQHRPSPRVGWSLGGGNVRTFIRLGPSIRRTDRAAERLVSLRDAANYITALPKKEANAPEWQAAIEALIKVVAEPGGPAMFARIGVMQALNRHSAKAEPAPRQKWARAYRVIRRSR